MKLFLSALAGICAYVTLLACAIGLDAFGTWLYGWETSGQIFAVTAIVAPFPASLIGGFTYEEIL